MEAPTTGPIADTIGHPGAPRARWSACISTLLVPPRPGCRPIARELPLDLPQRPREIGDQVGIFPLSGARPGDQHVIRVGAAVAQQYLGGGRAQPPLGAIAHNRVADLATGGKADP